MTRLEKELDEIVNTLMFPTRFAKSFTNSGSSYPPYNIIRMSENETVLEVAVAGFKENEVNVTVDNGKLLVSGKKDNNDVADYIFKGIGTRSFEKSFALSKDAKVEKAEYSDGILSVYVKYEVPEEKKPKSIPISRGERQYLTERDDIV